MTLQAPPIASPHLRPISRPSGAPPLHHVCSLQTSRTSAWHSANFYQAAVYAWNAYREGKTITSVKYDTNKGLYAVAA